MMDLKTFAQAVYSEPGVAQACLALQDNNGVDVPVLLFCGWYGAGYGKLALPDLRRAIEGSQHFSVHLIKPLRQTRRWMKTHSVDATTSARWDSLREDIKRAELTAELLMLDTLQLQFHMPGNTATPTAGEMQTPHVQQQSIRYNLSLLGRGENGQHAAAGADDQAESTRDACLELIAQACLQCSRNSGG